LTASVRAIIAERYTIPVTLRAARRAYALGHGTNEARVTTRFINQPVRHKGYNPGAA
jgi:hypothetical protein